MTNGWSSKKVDEIATCELDFLVNSIMSCIQGHGMQGEEKQTNMA